MLRCSLIELSTVIRWSWATDPVMAPRPCGPCAGLLPLWFENRTLTVRRRLFKALAVLSAVVLSAVVLPAVRPSAAAQENSAASMSVSNSILRARDALLNPAWRFQLDMRPISDAATRVASFCHLNRPGALLVLSSLLLGGIHVVLSGPSRRALQPRPSFPGTSDALDEPSDFPAEANPGLDAQQPPSPYGVSPDAQAAPTDDELACELEINRVEPSSPLRYEPFIVAPAPVKIPGGRLSPNSPQALLPEAIRSSYSLARSLSQDPLSTSSASAAVSRGSHRSQQWLHDARSPGGYVPFGSVPPPAAAISHDDLCAALVDAVSAVREEANAEKEVAIAAVRRQAEEELREAVATVSAEAEASVEAAVAAARAEREEERGAAIEEVRAAATAEAESRMEAAMVRVHLLMLGSVIVGATVNGLVELFGMVTTKGAASATTAVVVVQGVVKRR
jgi:hypothetical protein